MQVKNPTSGKRSQCPINAVVEVIGDQWSLLILRDMIFDLKTRYSEFRMADEGVATNILSSRLKHLVDHGLIEKRPDPQDGRASIYLPTDRALDMVPLLLAAMSWSEIHQPATNLPKGVMAAYRVDPHATATQVRERALHFRKETQK